MTQTSFYYPVGRAPASSDTDWLASDGDYFAGLCHIGHDFDAEEGEPVYAISDGEVYIDPSSNGWGTGNLALLIRHRLDNGNEFLALYGHIRTSFQKGDRIVAGAQLGTIGPYYNGDHLHFGILPSLSYPSNHWGRIASPCTYPYNGFVDPIAWIENQTPSGLDAGLYADGWHDDGISQAFLNAYQQNGGYTELGSPFDNCDGQYVHDVHGYWVQDFSQDGEHLNASIVYNI